MSERMQSPRRREDKRLLTGRARYVDNLHFDRMVHGTFIRSPMAHAEIVSVDSSQSQRAPSAC